jgi:hypothetical protein
MWLWVLSGCRRILGELRNHWNHALDGANAVLRSLQPKGRDAETHESPKKTNTWPLGRRFWGLHARYGQVTWDYNNGCILTVNHWNSLLMIVWPSPNMTFELSVWPWHDVGTCTQSCLCLKNFNRGYRCDVLHLIAAFMALQTSASNLGRGAPSWHCRWCHSDTKCRCTLW